MTKKRIIWLIIIIAVAAGGYFYYSKSKNPKIEYTTAEVQRGNLPQTVSVTGKLVDDQEIILNFELGGRVKQVYVKKGDKVAVGDKIAMIDDVSLNDQVRQAKAALDRAIADAGSNNDALHEAKVSVDNADNLLGKTEDLNDKNVDAAEQAVTNAQNYYDDALVYYNDGGTSTTKKLTLTTAANSLEAAKQSLKIAKDQADLSKTSAQNSLDSAKARLKTVESDYAEKSRDATIESARAGYDIAINTLLKTILRAPINGVITEVNNKVGEILGTGVIKESFARLVAMDLLIESNVPESDILKIKMGQKAEVTFDALTLDEKYGAEIVEINPASTVIQDVVYYGIKFRLTNVDQRLKPGMSANVDISTAEKENVLMIPLRAVQTEGNQKFVEILNSDGISITKVQIETGLEGDEGMVEVTSGLQAGQKVVTFTKTL